MRPPDRVALHARFIPRAPGLGIPCLLFGGQVSLDMTKIAPLAKSSRIVRLVAFCASKPVIDALEPDRFIWFASKPLFIVGFAKLMGLISNRSPTALNTASRKRLAVVTRHRRYRRQHHRRRRYRRQHRRRRHHRRRRYRHRYHRYRRRH